MVLQPNFCFTAFGTERSQQALTSKFFIKVRQLQLAVFHHKNNTFKFFLGIEAPSEHGRSQKFSFP